MSYSPPNSPYLRAIDERVLVFDGAMGTNIQLHHPTPEDFGGKSLEGCNDHLVLTRPDIIQSIHESFLAVGCDVVETCTFQSTPHRLREWGIEEKTRDLNVAAARLARAACDKYATPDKPRFVAGSIGPTGLLLSSSDPVLSNTTFAQLEENYYVQGKFLVEGGVDVLLVNTGTGDAVYPLEPTPMAEALGEFVRDFGVRIVGGCCGTTPAHLEEIVRVARDAGRVPRGAPGEARATRNAQRATIPGSI